MVLRSSCRTILQKLDKPISQISKDDVEKSLLEVKAMLRALEQLVSS